MRGLIILQIYLSLNQAIVQSYYNYIRLLSYPSLPFCYRLADTEWILVLIRHLEGGQHEAGLMV